MSPLNRYSITLVRQNLMSSVGFLNMNYKNLPWIMDRTISDHVLPDLKYFILLSLRR